MGQNESIIIIFKKKESTDPGNSPFIAHKYYNKAIKTNYGNPVVLLHDLRPSF